MKGGKVLGTLFTILFMALLALTGFCIYQVTAEDLRWTVEASLVSAMSMSCMVMCLVIYATILLDRNSNRGSCCFMVLVFLEYLLLFSSFQHWYCTMCDVEEYLVKAIDYANFLVFPSTVVTFAAFQMTISDIRSRIVKSVYCIMIGGFVIFALLVITNYFTGMFPEISEDIENFGSITLMRFGPYVAMLAFCVLSATVYGPSLKIKMVTILYLMVPALILVYEYPKWAPYACVASMLMLYFIYGNTFLERGVALARNEVEISEQKVAMLTSRIEPEFLLESLDSIIAMEGTSPVAKRAINLFKVYFRQNMNTISEKRPIPIVKELDHVKVYLSLEKLRFKEGLDVKFEITDTSFDIPAMTIQVLVENAVKHGITQKEEGGTVVIRTAEYEKSHRIQVIDDGVGFDTAAPRDTERSHIGIDNVVFRLDEMVHGTLDIRSTPGVGTIATITIPKN